MRDNFVHHIEHYKDGTIGIDRYGVDEPRVYHPTVASKNRLFRATMLWSNIPPSKFDVSRAHISHVTLAPMRKSNP